MMLEWSAGVVELTVTANAGKHNPTLESKLQVLMVLAENTTRLKVLGEGCSQDQTIEEMSTTSRIWKKTSIKERSKVRLATFTSRLGMERTKRYPKTYAQRSHVTYQAGTTAPKTQMTILMTTTERTVKR